MKRFMLAGDGRPTLGHKRDEESDNNELPKDLFKAVRVESCLALG